MWRACRTAALQHLHTRSTASSASIAHAIGQCAPAGQLWDARFFLTSSKSPPLTVSGIALRDLAKRSHRDLESEFGVHALRAARAVLPQTWDALLKAHDEHDDATDASSTAPPMSRDLAMQIFRAALKQRLPELALSVFDYMDTAFPTQVDFVVYGEIFTLLSSSGNGDAALAIFERNKPLYTADLPAPELIYRFGVFGLLGKCDFAGVQALLDEMQRLGLELSNELKSRLMVAYAKSGEREHVRALFATIDPQVGRWHEADVNRVVTSLGLIKCADEAFEFYRHAQIKLSGNTLVALLGVCCADGRHRQAMAILANRKRFGLALNVREYNKVLETLEAFSEHAQIAPVLDEMRDRGVAFDKLTRAIVVRNQHYLQGTPFETPSRSRSRSARFATVSVSAADDDGDDDDADSDSRLSVSEIRRKMQTLNASKAFARAAALADLHVTPVGEHGAMAIPSALAAEAVVAYANSSEHTKVEALVRGFASVKGDFGHALTSVVAFYSERDHALVYTAFKASLFQGRAIFRVKEALARFREFDDPDAVMMLFRQVFARIAVVLDANGGDYVQLKKTLTFDRTHVVKATLQVLLEHRDLAHVVEVLDTLDTHGFRVRAGDYTTIFRVMREQGGYRAADVDALWDDMVVRRGVQPTRAILAHSCGALTGGTAAQQQRALDAYALVRESPNDSYNLPAMCYSALLGVAVKRSDLPAVRELFDDALRSHQAARRANTKIRFYPREWVTAVVTKLARDGGDGDGNAHADEAFALVTAMKKRCGGFAYDAVVTALRMSALVGKHDHVEQLRSIFSRDAKFQLRLSDCEHLVRIAAAKRSLALALLALELFEEGNLVHSAAAEASASAPVDADADVDAAPAFELQKRPSAAKLKDIAAMYAAALALSEETDATSTAFLQSRVRELAELQQQH